MEFVDLGRQYAEIGADIDRRINIVLQHHRFIMGPEVQQLEEQLASFVGTRHCISCSSGTDALIMALMAWGIKPGDAVITTPFTFVAPAEAVSLLGATPVFVDIDPATFNIDPDAVQAAVDKVRQENRLTVKAIIAVDLFGLPANYARLEEIAEKNGLHLLEDAAQGLGGRVNNRRAGSFGDIAATSFFPVKPLGCYGDGGAVFTDDDAMAERLQSIRNHGMGKNRYDNVRVGLNGRLDTMQAAVLLSKLTIFQVELEKRNEIARAYTAGLRGPVEAPTIPEGTISAWAQYSLLLEHKAARDRCREALEAKGIPSAIYYPIPLHLLTVYQDLGYKRGSLPVAEDMADRILSIPMHPYLTADEIENVIHVINSSVDR